jgi:myo-inositol-1(or 4)-monophosphatase
MIDYTEKLAVAKKAALEAGKYILKAMPEKHHIDKKGIVNLVTEVDRGAEKIIYRIITEAFPQDRFIAEEGSSNDGKSGLVWYVDPLDGTTNFAHRLPHFCISIGLVEAGIPVAGCVYNPNLDECFTAAKGQGAFLNDKPIHVSQVENLTDSLLATGFPYDLRDSSEDNLVNFALFYKNCQAVRRAGAAALDLAYVACGRFDGFWEFKLQGWDIAAGIILVREAGGQVSNYSGNPVEITKGEVLASNGKIHSVMLDTLKKAYLAQQQFDFQSFFGKNHK